MYVQCQCDNQCVINTFCWICLEFREHYQTSFTGQVGTGRQYLLIYKSFNCNILLELVFLGIQDPMFQTFLVFFKIISVIWGIYVDLYQVYGILGPPLADPMFWSCIFRIS